MSAAPADFVHLRVRSEYSLLTAPIRVAELAAAAAADGQRMLALTDQGNLFGAIEFYRACRDAGVQPILGMIGWCAAGRRDEPTGADNPTYDLTLLAADARGWDNLRRLSSRAWLEGFHYRPRFDDELLAAHAGGLIVLSGGTGGEIAQRLLRHDEAGAARRAGEFRERFGDRYAIEIVEHGTDSQRRLNEQLIRLARATGVPLVATNDVHFLQPDDAVAQDILGCIQNGSTIANPQRPRLPSRELWLKSRAEMAQAFADLPEALHNAIAIGERCRVDLQFGVYHLPRFDTGTGETVEQMFERRCREGALARYRELTPAIEARLGHEIDVIRQLGFVSYFLITADFIQFARDRGIPVGPGRGSAAGSIVAYALRITDLDPLRYDLIFERFLNAGRVSMPDIDIDFCGDRRDEVIRYVRDKYGADNVCQIITFGTMASRGVLRDVGRVLEFPLAEIDKIAKKVPQGPGASLRQALATDKELAELSKASPENRRLFELGAKLEGLARHASVHAAGVVVADRPLIDYVPLARNGDEIVTQWQMTEIEEVGLLKVDFLGLKTLTILAEGCRLVHKRTGELPDLDHLPLDDRETYALIGRGDTLGVFQLESPGMRDLLIRLAPDSFEDLIAVLALYRPGPLGSGMVDMFVRRKRGFEPVAYPHESLTPILAGTYGVIVYQEQVMQIANVLAGFPMNKADELRKAMGKKKPEVMAKFKDQFVAGAVGNGHAAGFAREMFETIEYFAGYGFNKSHSAAYALLTYRTAWLKAHHPLEFFAANATVECGHSDKLKEFVDAARRAGYAVEPPDVNRSERAFTVEDGAIRFGLGGIKGVGARAADLLVAERAGGGPFRSLTDLCTRVDSSHLNKAALESLARAGAFGCFGGSRRAAFEGLDQIMRGAMATREDRRRGQRSLFGELPAADPGAAAAPEWSARERLQYEKEALGFYLSGHPLEKRGALLARIAGTDTRQLGGLEAGTIVRIAGMITGCRVLAIKSGPNAGQKMARFQLEDLHGSVPVTCFARSYATLHDRIRDDAIVFVRGKVEGGDESGLVLEDVEPAERVVRQEVASLVLGIDDGVGANELDRIAEAIGEFRGSHRLLFQVEDAGGRWRVACGGNHAVQICDELIDRLSAIVGPERLRFEPR
jgi:DNA polymerase-3 subunit alpha